MPADELLLLLLLLLLMPSLMALSMLLLLLLVLLLVLLLLVLLLAFLLNFALGWLRTFHVAIPRTLCVVILILKLTVLILVIARLPCRPRCFIAVEQRSILVLEASPAHEREVRVGASYYRAWTVV